MCLWATLLCLCITMLFVLLALCPNLLRPALTFSGAVCAAEMQNIRSESFHIAMIDLWRVMCTATLRLVAALQTTGMMPSLEPAYGSAEGRFLQRFESFKALSLPPFIDFAQVQEYVKPPEGTLLPACIHLNPATQHCCAWLSCQSAG